MSNLYGSTVPVIGQPYRGITAGLVIEHVTTPPVTASRFVREKAAHDGRLYRLYQFRAGRSLFQAAVPAAQVSNQFTHRRYGLPKGKRFLVLVAVLLTLYAVALIWIWLIGPANSSMFRLILTIGSFMGLSSVGFNILIPLIVPELLPKKNRNYQRDVVPPVAGHPGHQHHQDNIPQPQAHQA
jgi:hypothetical protein